MKTHSQLLFKIKALTLMQTAYSCFVAVEAAIESKSRRAHILGAPRQNQKVV